MNDLQEVFILFDNDFPIFDDYIFNDVDSFMKAENLKGKISEYIKEQDDNYYFFIHNKETLLSML